MSIEGLSHRQIQQRLDRLHAFFRERRGLMVGYQWSQQLEGQSDSLGRFLDYHLDNIGDPFSTSLTALNTKDFEREILNYFAALWHAHGPADSEEQDSFWGYVLSMGSTEGNLFALTNARDYLSGRPLLSQAHTAPQQWVGEEPAVTPVLLFSEDAHYSFAKAAVMLRIDTLHSLGGRLYPGQCPITPDGDWPIAVPSVGGSNGAGRIDASKLGTLVGFFADRGHPPLICLNLGSTFKGAYDFPEEVWQQISEPLDRNGLLRRTIADSDRQGYWIHIDAALGGGCLPFIEMAAEQGLIASAGPVFDFRLPFVSSIVTSGHKWFGTPYPSGVYMSKQKFRLAPPSNPRYIGSPDTTLAGARNGLSSLVLWYSIAAKQRSEQISAVCNSLNLADYATERLSELEALLNFPLWVERAPLALAVRFRRPADRIVATFGLVGERAQVSDEQREYVHVYVMPHVTKETINLLLDELATPDAFA